MKFCIAAFAFFTAICLAQSLASAPKFEVATIKLSDCDFSRFVPVAPAPGRLNRNCVHLRDLIQQAYGHYRFNPLRDQVLGGPGWLDSDFYDIVAKAEGTATMAQMTGPMMQALLEDRLKLKIHRVPKEVPVYELTVGKSGAKLQAAKRGGCVTSDPNHPPAPPVVGQPPFRQCGGRYDNGNGFDMYGATIADLCEALSFKMDRDVIDKTGIRGKFDIYLEITPNMDAVAASSGGGSDDPVPPSPADPQSAIAGFLRDAQKMNEGVLAPALRQQLGLKIESGKGPGETIVIDHIERPTGN